MKATMKVLFLFVLLVCLGVLTAVAASAATVEVGTQAAFGEALTNANAKTETSEPTVIKLTANINMADNTSYSISGKHVVIDGQGKYAITRAVYNQVIEGSARYLFVAGSGADVTFQNVTVNNHVFTLYLATNGGATVTLGENTHFVATLPSGFVDTAAALGTVPYLLENRVGNTLTVTETARVEYTASDVAADLIMIRNYGTLHIHGKLIDNTTSDTKDHRLIHCPSDAGLPAYIYIYETAEMTINSNGGDLDSTLMRLNGVECKIYGGKFSAPNWGKTTATNLPASLISVGSIEMTISGGTFTQDADAPMFLFFKGSGSGSLSVTGGEFTHNGIGNTFDVPVVTTVTLSGGTFTHNHTDYGHGTAVKGRTFFITADANVTIGGTATVTNKAGSAVYTSACSPTVTINGNAKVYGNAKKTYTLSFHAGKPVLNVGDSAYIRAGAFYEDGTPKGLVDGSDDIRNAYAIRFANDESTSMACDTTGFLTLNITGNPVIEASYTCVFVSTDSTDENAYNVLNIEGGTFITHRGNGINMKDGAKVSVASLKSATFQTVSTCVRFEQVTFKQTAVTLKECTFTPLGTDAICVQLGTAGDVITLSTLTLENCMTVTSGDTVYLGNKAEVGAVVVKTSGSEDFEYNNFITVNCQNTAVVTGVVLHHAGTGALTLSGLTLTNASTTPLITVSGKGTLNVVDCTLLQSGAAHAILVSADANINIGGTTNITVTGANGSVLYAAASPTVHIYGTPVLTSAYWALSFAGGKPTVIVDGGTVEGSYVLVYNNRTSYNPTADGFMTATVNGGTLNPTSNDSVYFNSSNSAVSVLTVTGGTLNAGADRYAVSTYGSSMVNVIITGGTFTDADMRCVVMPQVNSNVLLEITGGTYVIANDRGLVNVVGTAVLREGSFMKGITVTLSESAVLARMASEEACSLLVEDVTVNGTGNAKLLYASGAVKLTLTLKNVTANVTDGHMFYITGAVAGLKIDVQSGTYSTATGNLVYSTSTGNAVMNVYSDVRMKSAEGAIFDAEGLTANIYGGYFESSKGHILTARGGAVINVYAGTFYKKTSAAASAIYLAGDSTRNATVNVKGGAFYCEATGVPMFHGTNEKVTLNVESCTAWGHTNLITNHGKGSVSATQNNINYSVINGLDMRSGATLRLVKGSSGLRFVTNISAAAYNRFVGMADGGEVTFGTLIMPAQYLAWTRSYKGEYTKAALDALGLEYLDIRSTERGFSENADGSYTMNAAIANIKEVNEELAFAALSYVTYQVNGITVTQYSGFNDTKHVRSIYQVARAAANDISDTEQGVYTYQILENGNSNYVGKYSPYSGEQWQTISGWWRWSEDTKDEVKPLDLYMIAGQSNAAGYATMSDSFKETYGSKTYSNIFYSGGVSSYVVSEMTMTDGTTTKKVTKLGNPREYLAGKKLLAAGLGKNTNCVGAELGIGEMLSSYYNETTGRTAAIVKYAVGGTSMTDDFEASNNNTFGGNWCPPSYLARNGAKGAESGLLYRNFIKRVESTVEDYRAMGYIVTFRAMYWMQGEHDRSFEGITTTYPEMFKALAADVRADCRAMTPANPNTTVDIVVGQISKHFGGSVAAVNTGFIAMQKTLPSLVDNVYLINTGDMTLDQGDNGHWGCDQQVYIGKMVAYQFMTKTLGLSGVANPEG